MPHKARGERKYKLNKTVPVLRIPQEFPIELGVKRTPAAAFKALCDVIPTHFSALMSNHSPLITLCINRSLLGFGSLILPSSCTPQGLCTNSLFCLEHSFPQQNYFHLCSFHPFSSQPKCHHRGEPCLSTPWYPPSQILVGFLCDLIQFIHMFIICLGTWLCWSSALENKLCESRNSDDFTL